MTKPVVRKSAKATAENVAATLVRIEELVTG
jgi:hypothetical protein